MSGQLICDWNEDDANRISRWHDLVSNDSETGSTVTIDGLYTKSFKMFCCRHFRLCGVECACRVPVERDTDFGR